MIMHWAGPWLAEKKATWALFTRKMLSVTNPRVLSEPLRQGSVAGAVWTKWGQPGWRGQKRGAVPPQRAPLSLSQWLFCRNA